MGARKRPLLDLWALTAALIACWTQNARRQAIDLYKFPIEGLMYTRWHAWRPDGLKVRSVNNVVA